MQILEERTDAELVASSRAGDKQAFNQLLERYQVMATCVAFRLIGDPETVRELIQEAMLQAYLSLDRLRDDTRFKNWFYGIVLNICRDSLRKRKTAISLDQAYEGRSGAMIEMDMVHGLAPDPLEVAEERDLQRHVYQAISMLAPHNRAAIVLFYYEHLSTQEIATRLRISLTAVRNRLYKGREQLRNHLRSLYPDLIYPLSPKQGSDTMITVTIGRIVEEKSTALLLLLDEKKQRAWPLWIWLDNDVHFVPVQRLAQIKQKNIDQVDNGHSPLDFMVTLINALGGKLEALHIETLREGIFYALVHVYGQNGRHAIKARLIDVLPLALRLNCPILIPDAMFERASINLTDKPGTLEQQLDAAVMLAQRSAKLFRPRLITTFEPRNLDFSQGLQGWWYLMPQYQPDLVECHLDTQILYAGRPSYAITLREIPKANQHEHMVTVLHEGFLADNYCGKQVRLRVVTKTLTVGQAYFCLEVIGATKLIDQQPVRYRTSTQEKPIKGTTDWTTYELLLDVPKDGVAIEFSCVLHGKGQMWLSGIEFGEVEKHMG